MCVLLVICAWFGSAGCTALQEGFKDGVRDGLAAVLTAIIETPINFALDQAFGGG